MDILIKVLQFFMSLSLLVAIHEFGHFIMARIFKIRVEKFYIFFDPWFSLFKFKRGDTEYGLGWLPLGGYVKIAGMIDESMDTEQMKQPVQPWEFRAKPAWKRFMVMIAGVIMNVLMAMMIYAGLRYTYGESYMANEDVRWGYVFNETGEQMGFRDGDKIISIDGEPIDDIAEIRTKLLLTKDDRDIVVERGGAQHQFTIPFEDLLAMRRERKFADLYMICMPFIVDSVASAGALEAGLVSGDEVVAFDGKPFVGVVEATALLENEYKGDSVTLSVLRGSEKLDMRVAVSDEGKIGVILATDIFKPRTREFTFWQAIPAGVTMTGDAFKDYWDQLKLIFQPKTKMYEELGGFIAIGQIFPSEWDWMRFWSMTAMLSIMLAVLNILPIPGLDGGHALFTLWEIITGRKPSDKFLEIMQYIGFILLLALIIYANGNDIYRLFVG